MKKTTFDTIGAFFVYLRHKNGGMAGKRIRTLLLSGWAAVCAVSAQAQGVVPDRIMPDTAVNRQQYDNSNRFYRKLEEKAEHSPFFRRLVRALVSEDDRRFSPVSAETALEREVLRFSMFEGRRIDSIRIVRGEIFGGNYSQGDLRTLANDLHTVTGERRIRHSLLFREGEAVSPLLFAQTEQLLRALSYLSEVSIVLRESGEGPGVIVDVITRDAWSIGVSVRSAPHNRRYIDLYDSNFLGGGNRLDIRTYVNYKGRMYGGNMFLYHADNLWGSFFEFDLIGGRGYEEYDYGIRLGKEYLRPSDFIAGGIAEDRRYYEQQILNDTLPLVRSRNFEVWAGKSWAFPAAHGSFYIGARAQDRTFLERPAVLPDSNTHYHSRRLLVFNTGIYRETYYRGNMIYGYGRTENIPYGHRFELTAGRLWSEFGDNWYTAFDAAAGKQTGIGYFSAGAKISTCWNENLEPVQGALKVEFDGFSNLWKMRRSYLRQFLSLRYLHGFGRLRGEGEQLSFWRDDNPRGLRNPWECANTRLVMKNETVLFSPVYFYGFRFVFFGFADLGWIGDHPQPFKNDFYTAVGLGVRLKNERLIFGTIQLSLGMAVNHRGWVDNYRHLRYASQPSLQVPRFRAERPDVFEFR